MANNTDNETRLTFKGLYEGLKLLSIASLWSCMTCYCQHG